MEIKNQKQKKNHKQNKEIITYNFLANYIDITIRGLISFFTIGMIAYFILIKWLEMKIWFVLPIIFITSVIISPIINKISLGHKIQDKYDNLLRKIIMRRTKKQELDKCPLCKGKTKKKRIKKIGEELKQKIKCKNKKCRFEREYTIKL